MVTVNETNREPDGTFETLDADTLIGADVENSTLGDVPKSQGDGTLAMGTVEQLWSEDDNSPLTTSGNSVTYTMANQYDYVEIYISGTNTEASFTEATMTVNGVTSDYTIINNDGSQTQSASNSEGVLAINDGQTSNSIIKITKRFDSLAGHVIGTVATIRTNKFVTNAANAPLSEFELSANEPIGWEIEVYGR